MRSQRKARVGQEKRKSENRPSILKMLCAALLRSFRGLHSKKIKGNPWGNWTLGRPTAILVWARDCTTTLRRLLISAFLT